MVFLNLFPIVGKIFSQHFFNFFQLCSKAEGPSPCFGPTLFDLTQPNQNAAWSKCFGQKRTLSILDVLFCLAGEQVKPFFSNFSVSFLRNISTFDFLSCTQTQTSVSSIILIIIFTILLNRD